MIHRVHHRSVRPLTACLAAALLAAPLAAQDAEPPAAVTADSVGYYIGLSVGQNLLQQGFQTDDFNTESLMQGLSDALSKQDPKMSEEQLAQVSQQLGAMMQQRQQEMSQAAGAANLEKSKLFLQENAKKDGVESLESGLQYKVLSSGDGQTPSAEDTVRVHYTGTLIDGTKFDSSVDREEPVEFPVGQVIPGWTEALQQMKVGDKWMLYIPPELGYGAEGAGGLIGPNEALIFEVELLDVLQ